MFYIICLIIRDRRDKERERDRRDRDRDRDRGRLDRGRDDKGDHKRKSYFEKPAEEVSDIQKRHLCIMEIFLEYVFDVSTFDELANNCF